MSALYGRLQGERKQVTRTAHQGITAQVETWQGIVRVEMTKDGSYSVIVSGKNGEDRREILNGNVNARTVEILESSDVGEPSTV